MFELKDSFLDMYSFFDIDEEDFTYMKKVEDELKSEYEKYDKIKEFNQLKVLRAMQKARLSDIHFSSTTGYGYNDIGREKVKEIFANDYEIGRASCRERV